MQHTGTVKNIAYNSCTRIVYVIYSVVRGYPIDADPFILHGFNCTHLIVVQ